MEIVPSSTSNYPYYHWSRQGKCAHVEMALKHQNLMCFGRRSNYCEFLCSSGNCFWSAERSGLSCNVKNPMNPDLELWIGALERFHALRDWLNLLRFTEVSPMLMTKDSETSQNWSMPQFTSSDVATWNWRSFNDPSHIVGQKRRWPYLRRSACEWKLCLDGFDDETIDDSRQKLVWCKTAGNSSRLWKKWSDAMISKNKEVWSLMTSGRIWEEER